MVFQAPLTKMYIPCNLKVAVSGSSASGVKEDSDAHNVPSVKDLILVSAGCVGADPNMVSTLSDVNHRPENDNISNQKSRDKF